MVRLHPLLFLLILIPGISGCVERYYPTNDELTTGTLVINAHLTSQPGLQQVEVSRSVTLNYPSFEAISGCVVVAERDDGQTRTFYEKKSGYYYGDLDAGFLQTGSSFRVRVVTPEGNEYASEYDRLRPAPAIDSIYYQVETATLLTAEDSIRGIRFFIDFTYDDQAYEFIRWELVETYEFHNPDMKAFVFESPWRPGKPLPDTSNYRVCYITHRIQDIFSMSTEQLEFGTYIRKPFAFVPNDKIEQKLLHQYSLLVRQYSIGPEAYHYWNELKKTSQEQGFLFDRQPALLESNFCNVDDPEEKVLGFFSMAGVAEKRGMAADIPGLDKKPYRYYCLPVVKGPGGSSPTVYPAYFARAVYDGKTVFAEVNHHCVDCREYKGSTHIKPDYW